MLSEEQIKQTKEQVIAHIKSKFPEEKKQDSINQINSMNQQEFEEFLKQNKITSNQENSQKIQCIFCSIISGNTPSYKIDENKESIAILEINPISKAHTLIIPKEHITTSGKIPKQAFSLAKKIAKKISNKLKPKEVKISSTNLFGHEIINILPIYKDETLESPRYKENEKELKELQKKLEKKSKPRVKKQKAIKIKKISEKKLWLPKRIP